MPKKSQKELIQISIMIFLILGLLISLGLLIWMSLQTTTKTSKTKIVDEVDESEYSNRQRTNAPKIKRNLAKNT